MITGRATWPRSRGIEDRGGIRLGGSGHVVCYNRIRGFADAISVHPAYPCAAIDFYGNEISECTDDGIEMDYSDHNTRCFENRLTNVFQGISLQPVHGGPVYVFRNAMYNVGQETFKLHNGPSGGLLFHNTSVKSGMPWELMSGEPVSNCVSRNNLFVGTAGNYAFETTAPMQGCDFDYDGFAGRWKLVLKWNGVRYQSPDDVRWTAPVYRHVVRAGAEDHVPVRGSGAGRNREGVRGRERSAAGARLRRGRCGRPCPTSTTALPGPPRPGGVRSRPAAAALWAARLLSDGWFLS